MDTPQDSAFLVEVHRMSKHELVQWLIDHGTIYPNRQGLLRWTRAELEAHILATRGDRVRS